MRGMFLAILVVGGSTWCFRLNVGFHRGYHLGLGGTGESGRQYRCYVNGDDGAQRSGRRRVAHRTGTKLLVACHSIAIAVNRRRLGPVRPSHPAAASHPP